jgi:hypothetical protein
VVKRSWPIFSSTVILRSVDSTQALAAGDKVFAAPFEPALVFGATGFFSFGVSF